MATLYSRLSRPSNPRNIHRALWIVSYHPCMAAWLVLGVDRTRPAREGRVWVLLARAELLGNGLVRHEGWAEVHRHDVDLDAVERGADMWVRTQDDDGSDLYATTTA